MNLATTTSRALQFLFFALALASFSSPQASAKAFNPSHCKSHHSSQIHSVETGWNPRQTKAKHFRVAMSNESDHTEKTRQLSVRGGDEDEPSKSGKKLIREMVAE